MSYVVMITLQYFIELNWKQESKTRKNDNYQVQYDIYDNQQWQQK